VQQLQRGQVLTVQAFSGISLAVEEVLGH
jgi:hypothetical protein